MKKLIAIASVILGSTAILADEGIMAKLDFDNDGLINVEEAQVDPTLNAAFAKLDVNQDGYLSASEVTVKID